MQDLLLIGLLIAFGITINWNYYFETPETEELEEEFAVAAAPSQESFDRIPNASNLTMETYSEEVIPPSKQTTEALSAVAV